jgi:hypothetical protein
VTWRRLNVLVYAEMKYRICRGRYPTKGETKQRGYYSTVLYFTHPPSNKWHASGQCPDSTIIIIKYAPLSLVQPCSACVRASRSLSNIRSAVQSVNSDCFTSATRSLSWPAAILVVVVVCLHTTTTATNLPSSHPLSPLSPTVYP